MQKTSKPRSSITSERPDSTFFTDRDSDGDFYRTLLQAGIPVERHNDHLGSHGLVSDAEWISFCAQRGWVGVTHDQRLRYNRLAVDAVMRGGARLIVTIAKNATHKERGLNFIASMDLIERFLEEHQEPFIAKLYLRREGLKPWLLYSDWLRNKRSR
jgi:hypothetical protein